jgi:putative transposase
MARHRRLIVPGVALHVVQRGVDRQRCFRDDADYLVYLSNLRALARETRCAVHAYCLMTNHVHLLLTPPDAAAGIELMRDLGQRYVPYVNRRYSRTGTLWEGRFRSCVVDSREYVLACYRYIELNPVRASVVGSPSAYPWSSHRANTGDLDDPSLTEHIEYSALGSDRAARRAAYRAFCGAEDSPGFLAAVRDATSGGLPLVGDALKLQLAAEGSRVDRAKPGPRGQPEADAAVMSGELKF